MYDTEAVIYVPKMKEHNNFVSIRLNLIVRIGIPITWHTTNLEDTWYVAIFKDID